MVMVAGVKRRVLCGNGNGYEEGLLRGSGPCSFDGGVEEVSEGGRPDGCGLLGLSESVGDAGA